MAQKGYVHGSARFDNADVHLAMQPCYTQAPNCSLQGKRLDNVAINPGLFLPQSFSTPSNLIITFNERELAAWVLLLFTSTNHFDIERPIANKAL